MNIYFAGSIRGGRDNQGMYFEIISILKQYGNVFTEHIGSAELSPLGERELEDTYIYERDMYWLRQADILVADVSIPSTGVGYEIGFAENLGKKILCLYREGSPQKISGMINGNTNLTIRVYKDKEGLEQILEGFFK